MPLGSIAAHDPTLPWIERPSTPSEPADPLLRIKQALAALASPQDAVASAMRLVELGALALPHPASGATATRLRALSELAAADPTLARIAAGHVDARAILFDADCPARPGLYAVRTEDALDAERVACGWRLRGRLAPDHGDRVLVLAHAVDGPRLFDLGVGDLDHRAAGGVEDLVVTSDAEVGGPGFHARRTPHAALDLAACELGDAIGLCRARRAELRRGPATAQQIATVGAIAAVCHAMQLSLDMAARAVDRSAGESREVSEHRAQAVRQLVERGGGDVRALAAMKARL